MAPPPPPPPATATTTAATMMAAHIAPESESQNSAVHSIGYQTPLQQSTNLKTIVQMLRTLSVAPKQRERSSTSHLWHGIGQSLRDQPGRSIFGDPAVSLLCAAGGYLCISDVSFPISHPGIPHRLHPWNPSPAKFQEQLLGLHLS